MKFLESEYPKGTFKQQKTDGAYLNGFLSDNLAVYADKIVNDMHFLLIICGNDSVGNGKSTLASHVGAYLTNDINKKHGTQNTFTSKNIAMNRKKLVENSFKLPKYSVVVLDEGDDLTTHGMKQAAVELKRYFRKCRQLNQILILILPSFFELPKFYALARSHCLINVKFTGAFERGHFDFYGPKRKKKLYLKGKKDWDYHAATPDFNGSFFSSYTFFPNLVAEIEKYKKKKHEDMLDDANDERVVSPAVIERQVKQAMFNQIYNHFKGEHSQLELGEVFGVSDRTANRWVADERAKIEKLKSPKADTAPTLVNNSSEREVVSPEQPF